MISGKNKELYYVAPFAGAWIEILNPAQLNQTVSVAPFAGAWIEMLYCFIQSADTR